jgi:hypothetical protein
VTPRGAQDKDGQIEETHSISAGLDYPGVGPEHAWLKDTGRATYVCVTDSQALEGMQTLSKTEVGGVRGGKAGRESRPPGSPARRRVVHAELGGVQAGPLLARCSRHIIPASQRPLPVGQAN